MTIRHNAHPKRTRFNQTKVFFRGILSPNKTIREFPITSPTDRRPLVSEMLLNPISLSEIPIVLNTVSEQMFSEIKQTIFLTLFDDFGFEVGSMRSRSFWSSCIFES